MKKYLLTFVSVFIFSLVVFLSSCSKKASDPILVSTVSPTGLTLISPTSALDVSDTPTVRVSGVTSGDNVKLYSDSLCTTQVSTGTASGTTIDLISSSLTVGSYNFYATAGNSACSTATLTYTRFVCPAGFISVLANSTLGVAPFCVMQFEAKNVAGVATSQATIIPWVSTQTAAATACTGLGSNYDLISNPQWITIARNAENVAANWSGGVVGTGMIPRGHSDNSPASPIDVTDTNDSYNGTGNNSGQADGSGWEQKRTLTLSNGNIIWDLSGNVNEWVDWTMATGLQLGPTSCAAAYTEIPSVVCGALAAADYLPTNATYTTSQGVGSLYGGGGGAALRSGYWNDGTNSGVFRLGLNVGSAYSDTGTGFRCVYSP